MKSYDIVIFGNFTSDTIIQHGRKRHVDGGGFNYGAHAAAMMGLKVAAVTRLHKDDIRVVKKLENIGIDVYPTFTPESTQMILDYPTDNPDERILTCPATAGAYTPEQFEELEAKAFLINGSIRPEVPVNVVEFLSKKNGLLVADAQTFVRVVGPGSRLVNAEWPEKRTVLAMLDILKADVVEAESLTGEKDLREAAKIILSWGPKEAVLTHRDGILVYDGKAFYEAGFYPKELIGRSGRGDTCIASYAAARLSKPPAEAIYWSAAVTSLKMESDGPFMRPMADVAELMHKKYFK